MHGYAHMWSEAQAHPHAILEPTGTMLTGHGNEVKVSFSHAIDGDNNITSLIRTDITLTLMQWREASKAVEALIANAIEAGNGHEVTALSEVGA